MRRLLLPAVLIALCAPPLAAQGRTDYLNVESPQAHPIEVARVDGHDYLLVCNTPDNRVEIYDTDESQAAEARLLARVWVGMEPVSVRYHAGLERFYTANFLGDSITVVHLDAPTGPASLAAIVEQTTYVGDEPVDIAFYTLEPQVEPADIFPVDPPPPPPADDPFQQVHRAVAAQVPDPGDPQETLFITHMTLGRFGWRDALTLEPVIDNVFLIDPLVDDTFGTTPIQRAPKEPRAIAVRGDKLLILAFKGGNQLPNESQAIHDLDIWCADLTTGATSYHGGLGATNYNMAFASNGDLFLVGGEALNHLQDEPNVAAAETGFVESTFYFAKNPCAAGFDFEVRDVNLEPDAITVPQLLAAHKAVAQPGPPQPVLPDKPVDPDEALAQPTDVVPFEEGGTVTKVFFTAFGSDRIGIIEPTFGSDPVGWPLRRLDSRQFVPRPRGPRGLALKPANAAAPADPGARLYVLNRFDNSVTVIDPVAERILDDFDLAHDPRPPDLKDGQPFLYDARLSGNGFVSCASCHTDGRTDKLGWDLGTPGAPPVQIPTLLIDALAFDPLNPPNFPDDKGVLVTQSLQGLLNWDVEPSIQGLFTNAPYHWRADRASFLDFNPAFEALLGGSELDPTDMEKFRTFINGIHYPPNPEQPLGRRFSGTLGDPDIPILSDGTSTGAQRGLRIFHSAQVDKGIFSCAHCHSLPEGSNNRITDSVGGPLDEGGFPAETAALRGLLQREARLESGPDSEPNLSPVTAREGLFHNGDPTFLLTPTINGFNRTFFLGRLCPNDDPNTPDDDFDCENLVEINRFSHQIDWGLAPLAGLPYTVTTANLSDPLTNTAFRVLENHAEIANIGVAVQAFTGGGERGFWYDVSASPPGYREEPFVSGAPLLSRQELTALVTGSNRLVVLGTPVGSERRVAAPSGKAPALPSSRPADLVLLPMVPNVAYENVPNLTENWDGFDNQGLPNPSLFVHTLRIYQQVLLQDAASEGAFGLTGLRHDAPRRFQVKGQDITHGAKLHLFLTNDANGPPDLNLPPEQQDLAFIEIILPLHPVEDGDPSLVEGERKWQTAVEMEPIIYYAMMLGGGGAPFVLLAYQDENFVIPDPPPTGFFKPLEWNWYYVRAVNADDVNGDKTGDGGWQRLTLSPPP